PRRHQLIGLRGRRLRTCDQAENQGDRNSRLEHGNARVGVRGLSDSARSKKYKGRLIWPEGQKRRQSTWAETVLPLNQIRAGTLPGEDVKVGPDLSAVMDLVFVDAKKHDEYLPANVEFLVDAFFFPAFQRKRGRRTKRLPMDLFHSHQILLDELDFTQDAEEAARYSLLVIVPFLFQRLATQTLLRHPNLANH